MEAQLQRRVQRYGWDKAATHYEAHWSAPLRHGHVRLLELAWLAPGERVLDVACGTGIVSLAAARAVGPSGSVLGTDLSGEMVELARAAAASNGLANATFQRVDAQASLARRAPSMPACARFGLMYVPDPEAAVREMWRVARPGGRTVVSVWGQRNRCGWAEVFPDRRCAGGVGCLPAVLPPRNGGCIGIGNARGRLRRHRGRTYGHALELYRRRRCLQRGLPGRAGGAGLCSFRCGHAPRCACRVPRVDCATIGTERVTQYLVNSSSPHVASRCRNSSDCQPTSLLLQETHHVRSHHS